MPSEQIDYTEVLHGISGKLDAANHYLIALTHGNEEDGLRSVTDIFNGVDRLSVLLSGQDTTTLDYSIQLNKISQMLAWTDMLLLILLAVIFVSMGLFVGYQVTRWMKTRH